MLTRTCLWPLMWKCSICPIVSQPADGSLVKNQTQVLRKSGPSLDAGCMQSRISTCVNRERTTWQGSRSPVGEKWCTLPAPESSSTHAKVIKGKRERGRGREETEKARPGCETCWGSATLLGANMLDTHKGVEGWRVRWNRLCGLITRLWVASSKAWGVDFISGRSVTRLWGWNFFLWKDDLLSLRCLSNQDLGSVDDILIQSKSFFYTHFREW